MVDADPMIVANKCKPRKIVLHAIATNNFTSTYCAATTQHCTYVLLLPYDSCRQSPGKPCAQHAHTAKASRAPCPHQRHEQHPRSALHAATTPVTKMCHSSANHLPPCDGHTAGPLPLTHIPCAGTATHYPQQKCPAAATAQGSCDSSQPVLVLGLSPAGQTPPSSPLAIAEQQPCAHTRPRDPACCSWGHSTCTIPSAAPIACTPRVPAELPAQDAPYNVMQHAGSLPSTYNSAYSAALAHTKSFGAGHTATPPPQLLAEPRQPLRLLGTTQGLRRRWHVGTAPLATLLQPARHKQ